MLNFKNQFGIKSFRECFLKVQKFIIKLIISFYSLPNKSIHQLIQHYEIRPFDAFLSQLCIFCCVLIKHIPESIAMLLLCKEFAYFSNINLVKALIWGWRFNKCLTLKCVFPIFFLKLEKRIFTLRLTVFVKFKASFWKFDQNRICLSYIIFIQSCIV